MLSCFAENTQGADISAMHSFIKKCRSHYNESQYKNVFLESQNEKDTHLNYLFNLAFFDELLIATRNNPAAVFRTTGNPIYLLLSKYYIEGFEGDGDENIQQVPMAIIHPLHSERIRAQHGAFTIFPYPTKQSESDLSYMAMENLEHTKGILQKIIISDPYRIAEEMKKVGINESWLYPEAPFINNEIENG